MESPAWWTVLARLTEPHPAVTSAADRRVARTLAALLLGLPVVSIVTVLVQAAVAPATTARATSLLPWLLAAPVAYAFAVSPLYRVAGAFIVLLPVGATIQAVWTNPADPMPFMYLLIPIALAGAVFEARRIALVSAFVLVIGVILAAFASATLGVDETTRVGVVVVFLVIVLLASRAHLLAVEADRRKDLAAREALARRLLEASFGGLAVVRDGVIREANDGFVRLFGEVIGQPVGEFLPDAKLEAGPPRAPEEVAGRRPDGTFVPVALVSRPDSSQGGGVEHVVAVQDLSERDAIRARLHQTDRMAAMGQLAAGVAHEINNPLTWIVGNLERLAAGTDGELRHAAMQAAEGARRVRRIARDLDTFARARPGPVVAVDLAGVARSAVNLVRHDLAMGAALEEDYQPVAPIDADPTRAGQACLALLVNAAQAVAGGAGTRVRVSVGAEPSGHVRFAVEDDGPGIPEELKPRVFEPFFSTRSDGTGLGLAICRGLVHDMGGQMFLDDGPVRGTRIGFSVPPGRLPLDAGGDDDAIDVEHEAPRRARVLIIDDEPAICDLLHTALADHDVTVASNGEEGRRLALAAPWDVILCDLMMPVASGIDIYEALAAEAPGRERRVVFLTGGVFTPTAHEFLDRVKNSVMLKPFRLSRIRDLVAKAIT